MEKSTKIASYILLVLIVAIGVTGFVFVQTDNTPEEEVEIGTFNSSEQFQDFVEQEDNQNYLQLPMVDVAFQMTEETTDAAGGGDTDSSSYSTRQTNVQVSGIDEPDIVKLTDNAAYYSPPRQYFHYTIPESPTTDIMPIKPSEPPEPPTTKVIDTENTTIPDIVSEIEMNGKILRENNSLIIYNNTEIAGFDVSDKENPVKEWTYKLSNHTSVTTSRMADGTAYFVIGQYEPKCPVKPLVESDGVNCTDVYYPLNMNSSSGVYTVMTMNVNNGEIGSEVSFVGSQGDSTVYMNNENMYISYEQMNIDTEEFVEDKLSKLNVSDEVKTQVEDELMETDVNSEYEFRRVIRNTFEDYNETYRENYDKLTTAFNEYIQENQRDVYQTTILKMNVNGDNVEPEATGTIPGIPLNQYSFDEHNGDVRIATTVNPRDADNSQNDLYVLDESLNIKSSVQGMAEGQRVYAVRFIGDKGYIITYRQVDPLHVIDLSDHNNPKEVGTLKLPGFSDYLHKLSDGEIVGIGESENGKAKVVLFNVSDDENPEVADSVVLDNEWTTEVSNNYRAFIKDDENNRMYLPGSENVYVIGYEGGELELVETIEVSSNPKRVRILGDDLYIFHNNGVMSVDRDNFEINGGVGFTN